MLIQWHRKAVAQGWYLSILAKHTERLKQYTHSKIDYYESSIFSGKDENEADIYRFLLYCFHW